MREEYERDLHHAWMILETDELYKEDYQMRMLMENAIPGFLSVRGQGKDDKSQYRYEISGKISVKAKGEKEHWKFADLENFMRQFIQVLYAVKNYLLDVNCLSLDPGHIYVSDEIYYFCYCPGLEGNILEKFHELTEYFVSKVQTCFKKRLDQRCGNRCQAVLCLGQCHWYDGFRHDLRCGGRPFNSQRR